MKFFDVWQATANQNSVLKFTLFLLSTITITSLFLTIKTQSKPPVVIERSCESKALPLSDGKHTELEIREFIGLVMRARFNSNAGEGFHLLSEDEHRKRREEITNLTENQISQRVYPTQIKIEPGSASIELDRLLSHKKVRAATAVKYVVQFHKTTRTVENPYGLVLTQTKLEEAKNEKD